MFNAHRSKFSPEQAKPLIELVLDRLISDVDLVVTGSDITSRSKFIAYLKDNGIKCELIHGLPKDRLKFNYETKNQLIDAFNILLPLQKDELKNPAKHQSESNEGNPSKKIKNSH